MVFTMHFHTRHHVQYVSVVHSVLLSAQASLEVAVGTVRNTAPCSPLQNGVRAGPNFSVHCVRAPVQFKIQHTSTTRSYKPTWGAALSFDPGVQ